MEENKVRVEPTRPKHLSEMTFEEALATQAQAEKASLVIATLAAFREGQPAAIKLVTEALLESKYSEETKFVISDERLSEIILLAADAIRSGEIK